jgi:hypothetical protein
MTKLTLLGLVLLCGVARAADPQIVQTPASVSVRWPELDTWRQPAQPLRAVVQFHTDDGQPRPGVELDLLDPAMGHATVFTKPTGVTYRQASIAVSRGDQTILQIDVPIAPTLARPSTVPLRSDLLVGELGGAGVDIALPRVMAPDWSKIHRAAWNANIPTIALARQRRLVSCDFNPPVTYSLALVANQTAHPHDSTRKSVYLAATNPLFNRTQGEMDSRLHFLIELPLDPQWLSAPGAATVRMDPSAIRVHMDSRQVQIGVESLRITGERSGGLSQGQYQALVGDDGNLYFAMPYRGPLRFNVAKAAFEVAPVDVVVWYSQRLRRPENVQALSRIHGNASLEVRPDIDSSLFAHDGRVYVMFGRYLLLKHGNKPESLDLLSSALISIPQGDAWYDAAAFAGDVRLHAEGFPGRELSLYDTAPPLFEERYKIRELSGMGRQLVLWSYDYDRFWRLELDDAGQTQRILAVTHLAGQRIVKFSPTARWHHRGSQPLGVSLEVTLEGQDQATPVYLPADGDALLAQAPPKDTEVFDTGTAPVRQRRIAYARGRGYGQSAFRKSSLQTPAGLLAEGSLSITWDARQSISAAMASLQNLSQSAATSLSAGPAYMLAPLPGSDRQFIGAADYPSYFLSVYTLTDDGGVQRRHLLTGSESEPHAVTTGLGPYSTRWTRRGQAWDLWIVGYTGVSRMKWPGDGSIPQRVQVESLGLYLEDAQSLDGAAPGPLRWIHRVLPGLNDRIMVAGYNEVARGGTAYSNGIRWRSTDGTSPWQSLARLTRGHRMGGLASRLRISSDARPVLDVLATGAPDRSAHLTLSDELKPSPLQSRLFVLMDDGAKVHDRFSLTLGSSSDPIVSIEDVAVSATGLHGLVLTDGGGLLSVNLDDWQPSDAMQLPGRPLSSDRAPTLMTMANGDHALFISGTTPLEATLLHVHVAATGELQVRPLATLALDRPEALKGARALVGDTLVLGPPAMRDDATMTVLEHVLRVPAP